MEQTGGTDRQQTHAFIKSVPRNDYSCCSGEQACWGTSPKRGGTCFTPHVFIRRDEFGDLSHVHAVISNTSHAVGKLGARIAGYLHGGGGVGKGGSGGPDGHNMNP